MSKKGIVIAVIVIIIILLVAVSIGYYFISSDDSEVETEKEEKSVGTEWGDEYYAYLINEISNESDDSLLHDVDEAEVSFIDVDGYENPAMILEYNQDGTNYIGYVSITSDDDGISSYSNTYSNSTVEYLYNISEESYDWYIHTDNVEENSDIYILIRYNTDENMNEIIEKGILKSSVTTQETTDGEILTLTEYDETFVNVEADRGETGKIDLLNFSEDDLIEALTTATENYKTAEELQTEEVISTVEEAVEALNTKKQEIENAKKAVEEQGLAIGEYTLKYGSYESALGAGTITINSDGTFSYTGDYLFDLNTASTVSGTYTVELSSYFIEGEGQSSRECIIFVYNGVKEYFYSIDDNMFQDQEDGYYYQEN